MNSESLPANATTSNTDSITKDSESRLLKFDEDNRVSAGRDINVKITALDTDLAHLRAELGAINSSVEEGLDRLGDTDTDLTAKVSETYKRLGEIDNAYKSLLTISSRIDTDIQRLNGDVSAVAEQSATGIKTLEQSTITRSNEFSQKNQQVVTQVNHLVETSKLTGELLSQKIQATTEKILQFETHVVAEIESLSSATKDRSDAIEVSVESNKARILKLQSVDEAIIKRATTLEISSAELIVKSQNIQFSVEQLQFSTSSLSDGLDELRDKTEALEGVVSNHGSLINGLQKATSNITDKLAVLSSRENKHFNIVTVSFILLLLATVLIYFFQQSQFDVADAKITSNNEKLDALNSTMQQKIDKEITMVNDRILNMQDQVQSVEGRLSSDSPFSQIGSDNIIHGTQWIAELPSQNFIVQLAYVDNKNTMYELAQRYNYHLKDSLSYFEVEDKGVTKYVLLSGNYATQQQAVAQIQSMPAYIDMQRPVVQKLDGVQKYIAQK